MTNLLVPITVAAGDGIGPEIMKATLAILNAAGARIAPETIDVGEKIYLAGYSSGISEAAWESLYRTNILLKGPITTPQGGGYKSLNVTLRKTLQLFANVRRSSAYFPYVPTSFPKMDVVIIRENEEDTYAGIEHCQTNEVAQCLKLISRPGCERIIRYAFEYAKQFNRKTVTCFSKDNIMKMTDGLFHRVFNEIALDYPDIRNEHFIVDIGAARLATQPEQFDVIVTLNLYGDILSDVCAQLAGSVGLAGSANVGEHAVMFEAIHGSAPDIAGKNIANPSGLLHSAIQLLVHINQANIASRIENAWLKTLEDGIHTKDIYSTEHSTECASTERFTEALIERLGQLPHQFQKAHYINYTSPSIAYCKVPQTPVIKKRLIGVDIFIDNLNDIPPEELAKKIAAFETSLRLVVITSLGLKIWPNTRIVMPYLRHCCCRFQITEDPSVTDKTINHEEIIKILQYFNALDLDVIKTENLYAFANKFGFTLAQGQ